MVCQPLTIPLLCPVLHKKSAPTKTWLMVFRKIFPRSLRLQCQKELAPLVTEYLKSANTPSSPDSAVETVLDIWDFAGQHLYYATHPIFFSHRAIYLLVHNLQKNPNDLAEPSFKCGDDIMPLQNCSNETNLDMLLSWLVSVHSIRRPPTDQNFIETCKSNLHCLPPPVLVAGTHADKVSAQQMNDVESQIESSVQGKTYQEHVLVPFYRVDNTQSSNSPAVKKIGIWQIVCFCISFCFSTTIPWSG